MSCVLSIAKPNAACRSGRAVGLIGAALAASVLLTAPSFAQVVRLGATLSGAQEVPPTPSKGTGVLTASYDTTTKKLAWSVSYSGLTGVPFAAHFHGPAQPGQNAPIEVPAPHAEKNPIQGTAVLTAKQASDLLGGKMYFNIHTKTNPTGEIRGQIKQVKAS